LGEENPGFSGVKEELPVWFWTVKINLLF